MLKISATDIHSANSFSTKLEVYLFNVGQGDHILLKFPNSEYGIIDFFYDSSQKILEPPVLSYFKSLKKQLPIEEFNKITISFFCVSHTDFDHIKGVSDTIKWFQKEGIFIRDFWLGGAHDEVEFFNFFDDKIKKNLHKLTFLERVKYAHNIEHFSLKLDRFFKIFKDWQREGFSSDRYKYEEFGPGEYLSELRPLKKPSSIENCSAINLGPLGTQLVEYYNDLTNDIIKKILGIKHTTNSVDKNLMSHILKIKFGSSTLIFGGDTHKRVWDECLKYYNSSFSEASKLFGSNKAQFIKVSHHGSLNSSSSTIWNEILPKDSPVFLGISAGQHLGYNHPDSKTLSQIRQVNSSANILATNVCSNCLTDSLRPKEHHVWYDDYIASSKRYHNSVDKIVSSEISDIYDTFEKIKFEEHINSEENSNLNSHLGLFAYIFEIDFDDNEKTNVRIGLSKTNSTFDCFYQNHSEKLSLSCR